MSDFEPNGFIWRQANCANEGVAHVMTVKPANLRRARKHKARRLEGHRREDVRDDADDRANDGE